MRYEGRSVINIASNSIYSTQNTFKKSNKMLPINPRIQDLSYPRLGCLNPILLPTSNPSWEKFVSRNMLVGWVKFNFRNLIIKRILKYCNEFVNCVIVLHFHKEQMKFNFKRWGNFLFKPRKHIQPIQSFWANISTGWHWREQKYRLQLFLSLKFQPCNQVFPISS